MTKQASLFTAADELADIIGPDLAQAFCDHRKALRKPLIPHAAKLIANKLRKMPDPIAAVETAIEHGWLTVYEPSPQPRYRQQKPMSGLASVVEDFRQELMEDGYGDEGQEGGASKAYARLPLISGPH